MTRNELGLDPETERYNSALYWLPRIEKAGLPPPEMLEFVYAKRFLEKTYLSESDSPEPSRPSQIQRRRLVMDQRSAEAPRQKIETPPES